MNKTHIISIFTLTTGLLVLAGCTTQTTTNTNATVNTNTASDNANIEVATNTNAVVTNDNINEADTNENTNSDQESEVDTSDWLTYTNEEYGFSFRYPEDLSVESENGIFESKVIKGDYVKAYYIFDDENNLLVAAYPEGEFDSDRFINANKSTVEFAGVKAHQFSLSKRVAYSLDYYPTILPGKFRIEVFYDGNDKETIDSILGTFQLDI